MRLELATARYATTPAARSIGMMKIRSLTPEKNRHASTMRKRIIAVPRS